jgi:hypothetical protein
MSLPCCGVCIRCLCWRQTHATITHAGMPREERIPDGLILLACGALYHEHLNHVGESLMNHDAVPAGTTHIGRGQGAGGGFPVPFFYLPLPHSELCRQRFFKNSSTFSQITECGGQQWARRLEFNTRCACAHRKFTPKKTVLDGTASACQSHARIPCTEVLRFLQQTGGIQFEEDLLALHDPRRQPQDSATATLSN